MDGCSTGSPRARSVAVAWIPSYAVWECRRPGLEAGHARHHRGLATGAARRQDDRHRGIGRVYEIKDRAGKRESRVLVDKLTQPNGVAFHNGSLYVMAIDKFLRYDGIEGNPNVQPVDITAAFNMPPKQHHNWKFLNVGPDGKLYVPFGAPCNICEPEAQYAQIRRYNFDGSG